jgi:hypothetical protein
MSIKGQGELIPEERDKPERRLLRTTGLIAVLAGAGGSLGLLFHASHRRPPLLMAIFVIWVLSPFMGLILTDRFSKKWSVLTRATLYCMMLVVALGSLVIYGHDAVRPRLAQAAFVYVIVPPASCLLIASALAITALLSGRLRAGGDGL